MKKLFLFAILASIGAGILLFTNDQKPPNKQEILAQANNFALEQDRNVLRSTWLGDARTVAEKSTNNKAILIASFLEKNNVLVEPVPQGHKFLESGTSKDWVGLVLLNASDARLSSEWAQLASTKDPGGAHFLPDIRMIIIKTHFPISPTWRGIILLHEANHAYEYITRRYNVDDPHVFCDEERDTHALQNDIIQSVGGERYTRFVNALAEEIKSKLQKKGFAPGQAVYHHDRHYAELDEIFGPHESEFECDFRETSVWMHACFIMLENSFGQEAPEQKSVFLKTIYHANGVLKY